MRKLAFSAWAAAMMLSLGVSGQAAAETTASAGGNLIIGITSGDPLVMNPLYASDRTTLTIMQALYSPLYSYNEGKVEWGLAESLTPSADNRSYTLKLKPGLKWQDGQAITADDVVFTFNKLLDENQHSFFRSMFVYNNQPVAVSKVDDLTVKFTLPQVSAAFAGSLVQIYPIPQHVFANEADLSKSAKNDAPVGSGPFKFGEYRSGQYYALSRFDEYWNGKPKLEAVTYRFARDANAARLAMQNGEINLKLIDPQDVRPLKATGRFDFIIYPEGRLAYMVFNQNVDSMKNKALRQAIAYAINKDELVQTAFTSLDYAKPANSILTPDTLYQTGDVEAYPYNLDKAKALFRESGQPQGLKLRLAYINANKTQESMGLYIQQQLKGIGINVELLPLDANAMSQKGRDKNNTAYELSLGGYIMGAEPDGYKSLFMSNEDYNYAHYKNPAFDALWDKGAVETDAGRRAAIYKDIQQTVASEMLWYPIAYTNAVVAVDKRFGGTQEAEPKPVYLFQDLSKIYQQ
ncbi:ABC transporter substrate-binding protein [Dickeya dadantii]|uniref:ABC transporter substrate-binding protein n=1 Tax=Dickeya dadantii TaxID=204038 RepID=UPI0014956A06|nr:ABC transporter substrate-binding protein [Dickeya dadantii]NPE57205.1 ABC transporter substrate-binding protein [Dickeya dadantii]NPE68871.1 ABC transporter substrate-binding protein [Dickeya dadantii]